MAALDKFDFKEVDDIKESVELFKDSVIRRHATLAEKLSQSEERLVQAEKETHELARSIETLRGDLTLERRSSEELRDKLTQALEERVERGHYVDLTAKYQSLAERFESLRQDWMEAEQNLKTVAGPKIGMSNLKGWLYNVKKHIFEQEDVRLQNQTQIASLAKEIQSLREDAAKTREDHGIELRKIQDEKSALDSQIFELWSQHKNELSKAEEMALSRQRLNSEEKQAYESQIQGLRKQLEAQAETSGAFEKQIQHLKAEHQKQSEYWKSVRDVEREQALKAAAALGELKTENESLKHLLAVTESRLHDADQKTIELLAQSRRQIQDQDDICREYENRIRDLDEAVADEKRLNQKDRDLAGAEIAKVSRELQKVLRLAGTNEERYKQSEEQARIEKDRHRDQMSGLEERVGTMGAEIMQLRIDLQKSQSALLQENVRAATEKEKIIAEHREQSRQQAEKMNEILEQKNKITVSQAQELSETKSLSENRAADIRRLEGDKALLKQTIENMVRESQTQNDLMERLTSEVKSQAAKIESREKQLSGYCESLNRSKGDLREQISRFDYELQMSRSVNPIADYIKITEQEIRRVDLKLKKTPAISRDRVRLEECLDELFEQRDFLVMSVKRTVGDIDSQRARLHRILGADVMQASPPPPPVRKI